MNAKILKRWSAALRSGKFKQGRGTLRLDDGKGQRWCCLGVLCELHRRALGGKWKWFNTDEGGCLSYGTSLSNSKKGFPPGPVVAWAGMKSHNPALLLPFGGDDAMPRMSAADMNDYGDDGKANKRYGFKSIATALERTQAARML